MMTGDAQTTGVRREARIGRPGALAHARRGGEQARYLAALPQSIRRIVAVALCELRLQRLSPALWIAAGIIALVTAGLALLQGPAPGKTVTSATAAVAVCAGEALFASLLLPWVALATLARDTRRHFSPLLWTRPLAPGEYALGKALGLATIGLVLGVPPILLGWIAVSAIQGAWQPPNLWLGMLPVVVTTVILAAMVCLLCSCAAPNPTMGALGGTAFLLYLGAIGPRSLLSFLDLVATGIYASPSIGFGPDAPLLTAQRLAYVALALAVCCLSVLTFQVRKRRVAPRRGSWGSGAIAVLVAGLVTLAATAHFNIVAASYVTLGPAPAKPSLASVSHYVIEATIDPAGGTVAGTASIVLTPAPGGSSKPAEIFFALNPGLHVDRVAIAPASTVARAAGDGPASAPSGDGVAKAARFVTQLGWTRVNLQDSAYPQGAPLEITITYSGRWALGRDAYSPVAPPFSFGPSAAPGTDAVYSYVGQGTAFLEGDGRGGWYPLFWTQGALATFGSRQVFDRVRIRMPTTVRLFSSLADVTRSTDGSWQELETRSAGVLPVAFAAALTSPRAVTEGGATLYFSGDRPSEDSLRVELLALRQARALDIWLSPPASTPPAPSWIGVVVPLIQSPVAGPGLLLLPETPDTSGSVAFGTFPNADDVTLYRYVVQQVAQAWWQNAMDCAAQMPIYLAGPSSIQTPQGTTLLYANPPELLTMLATYSAITLTGNAYGRSYAATEVSARQAYHDQYHSPDPALVLVHLERELGPGKVTALLQNFVLRHRDGAATTESFVVAASAAAGRDITREAAPYLDPTS